MIMSKIIKHISVVVLLTNFVLFADTWIGFQTSYSGTLTESEENTIQYTITLSDNADGSSLITNNGAQISVVLTTGTATNGLNSTVNFADYDIASAITVLTFDGTETSKTIDINAVNDTRYENTETLILTLISPGGTGNAMTIRDGVTGGSAADQQLTINITSEDALPKLSFDVATSTATEGATSTITVEVDNTGSAIGVDTQVTWASTFPGSGAETYAVAADAGTDAVNGGTLTFSEGETSETFTITTNDDAVFEESETFNLGITGYTNGQSGTITSHQHTITDNDDQPVVSFSLAAANGAETGTINVGVTIDNAAGTDDLQVGVAIDASSTATNSGTYADHNLSPVTLNFDEGETTPSSALSFTITDDNIFEGDDGETIVLTLGSPNRLTLGTTTTYTYTINEGDTKPTVNIAAATTGSEAVTTPTITVSLWTAGGENMSGVPTTVNYANNPNAAAGVTATGTDVIGTGDYTVATSSITIPAYTTSGTFTINVNDDDLYEVDEVFIFGITSATPAVEGNYIQTYTIDDDDTPPSGGFVASASNPTEGDGAGVTNHTVTVSLSAVSGVDATFDYTVGVDGDGSTADATSGGTDFTFSSGSATIDAGETDEVFTIALANDDLYEGNEVFTIQLSSLTAFTTSGQLLHTVTILDNEAAPQIDFTAATSTGDESQATATFTVQLNTVSGLDAQVDWGIVGGTGVEDTDYGTAAVGASSGTLTIPANSLTTTFNLDIDDDLLYENDETIIFGFSNYSNALQGTNSNHTYTIENNDQAPTIGFSSANYPTGGETESSTSPDLTLMLDARSGLDASVNIARTAGTATGSGSDFTFTDAQVTIPAGDLTVDYSFAVNDDSNDEEDQTIIFDITGGSYVNSQAGLGIAQTTYTIVDDDPVPNIGFSDPTTSATEADGSITLGLTVSTESEKTITLTAADLGTGSATTTTDYTTTAGAITILPGVTTSNFVVNFVDDTEDEALETINFGLSGGTNVNITGNTTHRVDLTDSDPVPTLQFNTAAVTQDETFGTHTIQVDLNYKSYENITFDYAAIGASTATGGGTDYESGFGGSATITAGQTSTNITLEIIPDNLDEFDETVIIELSNAVTATTGTTVPIGGNSQFSVTITDVTAPPTVGFDSATGTAGDASNSNQSIGVTLSTVSGKNISIPFSINTGLTL